MKGCLSILQQSVKSAVFSCTCPGLQGLRITDEWYLRAHHWQNSNVAFVVGAMGAQLIPQPILNLHNCAISFIVLPNLDDSTICDLFKLVNMGIKGIKCIQIWLEHTRARNQGPSKPIATTSAAKMPETLGAGRTPRAVIMRIFLSSRKMRRQTPCKSSQWDPMGCLLLWGYHTRIYSLKPISWICWKLRTNHWGWMRWGLCLALQVVPPRCDHISLASCNLSRTAEAKLAVKLLPLRKAMEFLVEGDELPLKGVKRPITNSTTRPSGHPLKTCLVTCTFPYPTV